LHQKIHEWVTDIPTPSEDNAWEAFNMLKTLRAYNAISYEDTLDKRLTVLIAMFDCIEQPTADALRKQLDILRADQSKPS
jgi:hypothetical protein